MHVMHMMEGKVRANELSFFIREIINKFARGYRQVENKKGLQGFKVMDCSSALPVLGVMRDCITWSRTTL